MVSSEQVEQRLVTFLEPRLPEVEALDPDTDLLEAELIDSLLMVDLLAATEAEYGIRLENGDLAPRNFRTVAALARLVSERVNQPNASQPR